MGRLDQLLFVEYQDVVALLAVRQGFMARRRKLLTVFGDGSRGVANHFVAFLQGELRHVTVELLAGEIVVIWTTRHGIALAVQVIGGMRSSLLAVGRDRLHLQRNLVARFGVRAGL